MSGDLRPLEDELDVDEDSESDIPSGEFSMAPCAQILNRVRRRSERSQSEARDDDHLSTGSTVGTTTDHSQGTNAPETGGSFKNIQVCTLNFFSK